MKEREEFNTKIEERFKVNRFYKSMFNIQQNEYFNSFMALAIISNTICLALDRYPVDLT